MIKMETFKFKEETYNIIGAAMEVHSTLGRGFLEGVYHEALMIEFAKRKIPYKHEAELSISYKGTELSKKYIADFICYESIIVELKAVAEITPDFEGQLLNYLKASELEIGLLLNFGNKSLEHKRLISY